MNEHPFPSPLGVDPLYAEPDQSVDDSWGVECAWVCQGAPFTGGLAGGLSDGASRTWASSSGWAEIAG